MGKTIYTLKLHESMDVSVGLGWVVTVTRVAGGWVYVYGGQNNTSVFVPLDNEFMP